MICRHCGLDKLASDFPNHRGRCKECRNSYYKEWYKKNGRKRPKNYLEVADIWRIKNPEKWRAKNNVQRAVKVGKIRKDKVCSLCQRNTRLVGHHIDYKEELGVIWLCSSCHKRVHTGDIKLNVVT